MSMISLHVNGFELIQSFHGCTNENKNWATYAGKFMGDFPVIQNDLINSQLETLSIVSIVAADDLVLKHQAISTHSAGAIFIIPDQFNFT